MHKTLRTCAQLLKEYRESGLSGQSNGNKGKKLNFLSGEDFLGKDGKKKDIYNITAPFEWEGKVYLAGRVEERESEYSQAVFFERRTEGWAPVLQAPVLKLQDPFVTKIDGFLVVGGVEVFPDRANKDRLCWRTVFYKGARLSGLAEFLKGPEGMKDIRLLQLRDGRILTAVRPQGEMGGRGKIGFIIVERLEELTKERIQAAPVLNGQFINEEWGGCNEMHLLSNGRVGILSHIACFDKAGNRHYYATCFTYDVDTGEFTPMKLISERRDFAPGESKRPDLEDVIFSGGLVRRKDGKAELYCGVGDAEAQMRVIEDPFEATERIKAAEGKKQCFKKE